MIRAVAGVLAALAAAVWWPWPAAGADPVVDLLALRSPAVHGALRTWHYLAPVVGVVLVWSLVVSIGRVWVGRRSSGRRRGALPPWPLNGREAEPELVVGEVHHPVRVEEAASPEWLVLPARGLYTGIAIFGAIGSGKTSACMRPFARQLLSWQSADPRKRMAGLVLEVKGDFCHDIRKVLKDAGREEDYVELGIGGCWQWNPLSAHWLDSYSLAYTIASLINQLFGRGNDPFWQLAYVNVVRWIIELHRMRGNQWVTLRDVYRCMLNPEELEKRLRDVEKEATPRAQVRISAVDLAARASALKEFGEWKENGDVVELEATPELLEALQAAEVVHEHVSVEPDAGLQERFAALKLWYEQDWLGLDNKLRSTIVEGLSVFLSLFDLPEVARVFCPAAPPERRPEGADDAAVHEAVAVMRPLPPLDRLIEDGKVIALNMPAGTNPALSSAVGVLLKQAWFQALLLRPAEAKRRPEWTPRPAVFLCDEYQAFATVGERDPAGDEKAFALTRQSRLIPIVATQSISSLRAVLGQSEAWRALLQTLRTRIFLSLSDESSAQIASAMCGQVPRMKASYTVSEQTGRASASLLSGSAGGGTGSVGASKAFSERREPLFHPRDFALLENCQAIVMPYDGTRALDAARCYLKPDYLPREQSYWRARERQEV